MGQKATLEEAHAAFTRKAWGQAYELLCSADGESALDPGDLEQLAAAAYLVGRESAAVAAWKRAHHEWVEQRRLEQAARCGFWIAFSLLLGGEPAQAAGWLGRTQRLIEDHEPGCVEQGYLLVLNGLLAMGKGDAATANATFERALEVADRFANPELMALGLLSRGQAWIQLQRPSDGVVLLDEAMVAVTAGEVSPILAGVLYCAAILTCQRIFDLQRSKEWTVALNEWCSSQPGLVAFRGPCLVHRSEILQLQGEWPAALEEAERACKHLAEESKGSAGRAFYQRGELHRLLGELELAEQMYREAGLNGMEPQPGMSLLRLARGQLDAAKASIIRVVSEAVNRQGPGGSVPRARVLGPYVEIMLAADELERARTAADELAVMGAESEVPFLRAMSAEAMGAVRLADGRAEEALACLREAWAAWQQLDAPYEAARVRVLIGQACHQCGDHDTAQIHIDSATSVFERLGAAPDLARLHELTGSRIAVRGLGLTQRELEVLALVAAGKTNRQIGTNLHISEHTVARHVSNIFNKIGVSSRTAASAFAYEHGLV